MAGGARLVTALGGVPARFGVDGGILLRGRHDAPGQQARGVGDWLRRVCRR